jgi:hypothetical protein
VIHTKALGLAMKCSPAVKVAQHEDPDHVNAILTADNQLMLHICQKLGFRFQPGDNEN